MKDEQEKLIEYLAATEIVIEKNDGKNQKTTCLHARKHGKHVVCLMGTPIKPGMSAEDFGCDIFIAEGTPEKGIEFFEYAGKDHSDLLLNMLDEIEEIAKQISIK